MIEYWITHRRKDSIGNISHVQLLDQLGRASVCTKRDVVTLIEAHAPGAVYTATWDGTKYNTGAPVGVISVGGVKFLRTDSNKEPMDNLDALPPC